ncbi:DNA-binding transcriptional regulator, LysR family [Epibacterium ulvae]|uniref:DNA-binding transcriptional regulator, LysR family n=2 Tax=Epibacterium ulvae TaxID=1156985 RepID=A0A1G5R1W2_9RHOB|nr:DNA-binding transcriptional regulator, LysR family [Epibacterium ulvae]
MVSIYTMEKTDYLNIDGHQLRILLTIREAGSLSGAAKILDMNQSTISYWLDLLRKRTGDPLFVRHGNGVEPTARARDLFPAAEAALRQIEAMFEPQLYDPAEDHGVLRIACTALERDTLLKPLIHHAQQVAPALSFELPNSGSSFQLIERLRLGTLDAVFMPAGSSERDGILQRTLSRFSDAVYFDPQYPLETDNLDAFCDRPQVRVAFGPDAGFSIDRKLTKMGRTRHVAVQVSDFESALALIAGTRLIATLPALLNRQGLQKIAPPWENPQRELALYWHARNQTSARHRYWRDTLAKLAKSD